ncbi:MAG: hypothetical protein KDA44_13165 [Planctomycetales bacterium]|nr:hypothetical protein [Planctomycetales bacterium]
MKPKFALCLVVDGLRASALGAYGNTWAPTPACDALAADSIVCDRMWCDSPTLAGFYNAVWSGRHAVAELSLAAPGALPLPAQLHAAGVATTLITDDASLETALPADSRVEGALAATDPPRESAGDLEATAMYQFFAAAAEEIAATLSAGAGDPSSGGRLWWLHCRGLAGAWDAPLSVRESLWADDELELPTFVDPPREVATDEPDQLLAYRAAYAAQVAVLDECVGALLAAVRECGLNESLLVTLVGARGFALGEHGRVGAAVDQLFGERLHVPCFVQASRDGVPWQRRGELQQPGALYATLRDWFGVEGDAGTGRRGSLLQADDPGDSESSCAVAVGQHAECTVVTDEWLLRRPPHEGSGPRPAPQLYAKPDDRWEANEVADLCPDAVAELTGVAARLGLAHDQP